MACDVTMNRTPQLSRFSRLVTKLDTLRPKRSIFQHITTSNLCSLASLSSLLSCGRLCLAPLQPVSTYSAAIGQPRRWQYERNSSNCISHFWSSVLTRAYNAHEGMLFVMTLA